MGTAFYKNFSSLYDSTLNILCSHGCAPRGKLPYLHRLRNLTDKPVWQAFRIKSREDVERAKRSSADRILLDSGAGTGLSFNWGFIGELQRPYLLAGGLTPGSVGLALKKLSPWGVDVSSGIETDGRKDPEKMAAFVAAVRKEDTR